MFKVREIFGFKSSGSKIKNRVKACLKMALDDKYLDYKNSVITAGTKSIKKINKQILQKKV